ncbi:hypothetical protein [Flavobacterium collinsii]|jgi:hypothetical protein|uniref:Natural product n=1 Tax=Flavobacterium collinsii TaxID=1114861 RepID=A0ABN7ES80_9FLAO|nr:hypothetical protein [Flavobacterium collinsii]GIQ57805.1 hypothetical protein Flavo103_09410 [Flavobacterium collinsii]CAA9202997.1 hypothetical protein FLACOL7796_04556 [Flavobacterium collinsii]
MKKKLIVDLVLRKEVVTKLNLEKIKGGQYAEEDTYTHKQSPMTSCNGTCKTVPVNQ